MSTTRTPLRILIVDDCREDRELYRRLIARGFAQDHIIAETETAEEALERIATAEPHCILLDYRLPDGDGLSFLSALRLSHGDGHIPVVMLTGGGDESVAVQAMKRGAQDYLTKSSVSAESLRRAIHGAMKRVAEQQQLRRSASIDELTGACNRRWLLERLREESVRARRHRTPLCVLMLDLDHFKRVNDAYGHRIGDAVLEGVGRVLRTTLRAGDFAGRYGGEEFCVVLTDTPLAGARVVAERIRRQVRALEVGAPDGSVIGVACSIGVAQADTGRDPMEAVELADRALYRAKATGRDRVELAPPPILPITAAHA
ncbi:MAG: diguanylate cyclase [Deltaproteobacteria bacterium]|nr:diguanylate cyclase [Deltaproteobacteria bacterium]